MVKVDVMSCGYGSGGIVYGCGVTMVDVVRYHYGEGGERVWMWV